MTGPAAMPTEETAAHIPRAVARSLGSVKMTRIMDRVVGMIMAPPTPSRTRIPMSAAGESATSTAREARANTAKPASRTRLRPNRSATALIGTSNPARTRE